ncbi:MAG: 3-deoxy-manno-octulosonate cytidylyltransferase [Bacteroidales bacterium]|nr:3-deoxy-manno-octulosonate cytidylyltransferase [Bacteroidales bacterium]
MNIIAVIPARYGSTRFPGKPLALLGDVPIIERVYKNAAQCVEQVWVATDDERIAEAVSSFGGRVVMTAETHRSGTDRVAEAAAEIGLNCDFDVVINVQGDEPFVQNEQLVALTECFADPETQIATLIKPITVPADIFNANRPKVVIDRYGYALMFSRSPLPYVRGKAQHEWHEAHQFFCHLGMYAYRADVLQEITRLTPSSLETAESLEQLRWLENGYRIKTAITTFDSIGIDTPEDLEAANKLLTR